VLQRSKETLMATFNKDCL